MGFMDLRTVVNDLAGGKVSAERIAFLKDRLEAMDQEKTELKQTVAELQAEIAELHQKLRAQARPSSEQPFEEAMGALFKRKPGGGYHDVVFCPRCRLATKPEPIFDMFHGGPCDWASPFPPRDLPSILQSLPR